MPRKPALIALISFALILLVLIELRPWRQGVAPPATEKSEEARAGGGVASKSDLGGGPASVLKAEKQALAYADSQPIRAQLSPVTYTTIAAELSAKIQELPRREGEFFNQGDTLVVFDCTAQRANLAKSQASLAIAERNYQTNERLIKLGAVGKVEFDNSYSEFQKAKAEVDELSAIIARCRISAPFPGRIVEQHVRSQQFVQSGQQIVDILDNRALELEFIAPSKWSPWLTQGYRFEIKIDETAKSYPARVTRVGARIDSVSQTFKVAAVISGSYRELTPGMSGTLDIQPPTQSKQ